MTRREEIAAALRSIHGVDAVTFRANVRDYMSAFVPLITVFSVSRGKDTVFWWGGQDADTGDCVARPERVKAQVEFLLGCEEIMRELTVQKDYPTWVCHDCATAAGGKVPSGHLSSVHVGKCDVCKEEKSVTEPRDYGYPKFTNTNE